MLDWFSLLAPAWLAGAILALLTAPLGCLMLWRRMAFFADTLAHGTLLGVGLSALWMLPYWVGVACTSLLLVSVLWVLHDRRLPMDALLALCASSLLCAGLLLINGLPTVRPELLAYLFGDLLALRWLDLPALLVATMLGLGVLGYCWRDQLLLAVDADLAASDGVRPRMQRLIFMLLLALFTVLALKAVGSLLMGALLVIPALTARLLAHSPQRMVLLAFVFAQLGIAAGLWGSAWLNVSTGPAIVLAMAMAFSAVFAWRRLVKTSVGRA
ncbi:MAG: metal ABC transporter permease [Pseudomonadota bacterium]|nr:metal ABC transporter permease [Pseudomonadota bacterium]